MRVTVYSESTRCYIADERACWRPVSYMFRSVGRTCTMVTMVLDGEWRR